MNFRHLKYFVATAESGQVSRAALMMNITQSAVTNAIKEIETEISASLFIRSSKGMELTPQGRVFLQSAYDILDKYEQALLPSSQNEEIKGVVKLAVTYTVAGYFLPTHLNRLRLLYPNIYIEIYEQTREAIEEGLMSQRYDLAVVLTSNTQNPELETETLQRSERRLWVSSSHPLAQERVVSFEQISEVPYIMLTVDEAAYTTMRYWSETDWRPNVRLRTSSIEAVRSMVGNGEGVAILSDMVYRPWSLEGHRILTAATSPEPPTMNIGLAWRKYQEPQPTTNALISYFNSTLRNSGMELNV